MKNKILEIMSNITWLQVFVNFMILIVAIVKFQNPTWNRIIYFTALLIIVNTTIYSLCKNLKKLKDLLWKL